MYSVLIGLQVIGLGLIVYSLIYMFRGESTYAQKLMIFFMAAELVQNSGFLLELLAKSKEAAMTAVKFQYIGSCLVALFYMMFVRYYCTRREKKAFERILFAIDAVIWIMVWTCEYHSLYYTKVDFVHTGLYPHLELSYGTFFYLYMLNSAIIPWFMSLSILIRVYFKEENEKKKKNLRLVILFTAVSLAIMFMYVTRVFPAGYDPTPICMAFMLSLMVIFIWNRKDYDLIREAANTALNALDYCVVTVDQDGEILSFNDCAFILFPNLKISGRLGEVNRFPMQILDPKDDGKFVMGNRHYESSVKKLEGVDHDIRGYTILLMDVTDTFEYIEKVDEMRKNAENANRAKTDFLANMSHEIRTPMNAVVGMSELIIEESRGRKVYDYACNIKSAALNLLSIINGILDLSKVEAGKMELVMEPYYIQLLIQDMESLIHVAAAQNGLQLRVKMSDAIPCQLIGDEGRIRQILINILNNAIKFTKKGYVSLEVSGICTDNDRCLLKFVIEDTGIGIREEEIKTIFEAFEQVDMSRNRKKEGTGLGLAITQRLVQLMGGSIQVESEYGKGTRFTVEIAQQIEDYHTVKENPVNREEMQSVDDRMFTVPDYRVLVVDDNKINRNVATSMLKMYKMQVDEAECGKDAISFAKENKYDMILLDHMMPEMDGIETARHIRTECGSNGRTVVIVALTANAIQGAREMYLENGFDEFLSKPFERIQLHALLAKWIPERRKEYKENGYVKKDKISEDDMAEIFMHGINIRKAATSGAGDITDYLNLLDLFYADGVEKIPYFEELVQNEDYKNYAIETHALKSAAINIGAEALSAEAQEHEMAAKEGDENFIKDKYQRLIVDYEEVLSEIERVLKKKQFGQFEEKSGGERKPIDEEDIYPEVEKILHNLEKFHSKEAAKGVDSLLEYVLPEMVETRLKKIKSLLKRYEDDDAEDGLRELLDDLSK